MDLSRRGFLGGLLASAAAVVLKVTPKVGESFVFLVFDLGGRLTMRTELTEHEVRYLQQTERVLGEPVPVRVIDLREHMLLMLLAHEGLAVRVMHGEKVVYSKRLVCGFQEWHPPTLPKHGRSVHRCLRNVDHEQGRMDEKRWRELVDGVQEPLRTQMLTGEYPTS